MDRDTLIRRLMATFVEELDEHVRDWNRLLLELEKQAPGTGQDERLRALFRTAHSLKGAARSVSVDQLEAACHHLEDILGAVRDRRRELDAPLFTLLFAAADAIEEAGMRLREEQDLLGSRLEALLPRLEEAAQQVLTAPAPATQTPAAVGPVFNRAGPVENRPHGGRTTPSVPPGPETEHPPPESSASTRADTEPAAASVRVAAEKLDALLARTGELLVGRRRLQGRTQDLVVLRELVGRWGADWRRTARVDRGGGGVARAAATGEQLVRVGRGVQREELERVADHLGRVERDLERLTVGLQADTRALALTARALDEEVRRARMLPFADACQGLERLVRDLAQGAGKQVELVVHGTPVQLDRTALEGLKDPLRHLVRNAVDHALELPAQRTAAGKPARGRVTVTAELYGNRVEVAVADDGRGLDLAALRQQARQRGLPEPADDREAADLIFLPGLSTARVVSDVSGRGVGLDVVKNRVESLHGSVEVESTSGAGTRFLLSLPLTLTTLRVLLVTAGGQTFAFPSVAVQKVLRVELAQLRSVEGRPMIALDGVPRPVADLAAALGLPGREPAAGGRVPALVAAAGDRRVVFLVDEFSAEQEVVIKALGARLRPLRHVSGATILPSGEVVLVLNTAALVRRGLTQALARPTAAAPPATAPPRKRILIAEDSMTTRTLQKTILEAAGYEVLTAPDGAAAWQLLQQQGADLLLSDIEMPLLDGIALTRTVRGVERFATLPVVLMTSRGSEEDRARGVEAGADAYLVKSGFDQANLLETLAQLL